MSAQANITVFDGAATPVTHTFVAVRTGMDPKSSENYAEWRENLASVPVYACSRIRVSTRRLKNGVTRVSATVEVPVMEAVLNQNALGYTAPPAVAHVVSESFVGYFHERATQTDKRLTRMLLVNFLNNISTSVAAATTGPASELIDSLIVPS